MNGFLEDFIKLLSDAKTPIQRQIAYQKLLRMGVDQYTADYLVKQYRAGKLEDN